MKKIILTLLLVLTACVQISPTNPVAPAASPTPSASFTVNIHPDGPLYVGDLVSLEVYSPTNSETKNKSVLVSQAGKSLGEKSFEPSNMISGRNQVTFPWVWDTHGLKAGEYTLTFKITPDGTSWTQNINLLPAADLPASYANAHWELTESTCCIIHTISGSDASNDITSLKAMVDAQAVDVERRMNTTLTDKIPITFLPRVIGHGGFTREAIYVTYMHDNYAGGSTQQVVHHEMVHWVDGKLGDGGLRPTMLLEGLAVYLSGGHFKVEPIMARSAAIVNLGWYIPLPKLANSFYLSQHEISYMEGASLISFMVSIYGWDKFNSFYRDIHPSQDGKDATAMDAALQAHFSISFIQLEQNYLTNLRQQTVTADEQTDMRLTVDFYNTVRRYQQKLDPSAYFLNAWLPDGPSMVQRNIVADFLRRPMSATNQQVEMLLVSADKNLRGTNYPAAETEIRLANLLLDVLDEVSQ